LYKKNDSERRLSVILLLSIFDDIFLNKVIYLPIYMELFF